jgi:hypothetical protein
LFFWFLDTASILPQQQYTENENNRVETDDNDVEKETKREIPRFVSPSSMIVTHSTSISEHVYRNIDRGDPEYEYSDHRHGTPTRL